MPTPALTVDDNVRYDVRSDLQATIVVHREHLQLDTYRARLVDLSQTGAKLSVETELEISDRVRLRLEIPKLRLDLYVAGEICWCQTMVGSRWLLGCQLKPVLPADFLARLTTSRCADRRTVSRQDVHVDLQGRSPLHPRPLSVRVEDLSRHGARLWSPHCLEVGERIRLYREECTQLGAAEAIVQWHCDVSDGHLLGCRFYTENGIQVLDRILANSTGS